MYLGMKFSKEGLKEFIDLSIEVRRARAHCKVCGSAFGAGTAQSWALHEPTPDYMSLNWWQIKKIAKQSRSWRRRSQGFLSPQTLVKEVNSWEGMYEVWTGCCASPKIPLHLTDDKKRQFYFNKSKMEARNIMNNSYAFWKYFIKKLGKYFIENRQFLWLMRVQEPMKGSDKRGGGWTYRHTQRVTKGGEFGSCSIQLKKAITWLVCALLLKAKKY